MYCWKEGILIGNFLGEYYDIPKVTMVNNLIHNNKEYGVVLARSMMVSDVKDASAARTDSPPSWGIASLCRGFRHQQLPECAASRES